VIAVIILKIAPDAAKTVDWRVLLGIGFVPAIISLLLRARMPESPRWLLERGREADVVTAMKKLDITVTAEDVHAEARAVQQTKAQVKSVSNWTPAVRRALLVVCVFFVFQQITGINVPFYYGPKVLTPYIGSGGAVQTTISGVIAASILAVVNVIATYFAFRFIDKVGRRKLAIRAYTAMIVALLIGAGGLAFTTGTTRLIILMVAFAGFISAFAIGIGGTGWLIQGEVFPTAVRGRAAAIGAAVDWLANWVLVLAFPILQAGIGLAWVMVLFAVLCALGAGFVYRFLPETKGHGADEVINLFDGPVNLQSPGEPSAVAAAR
jgi:MFS family permease